MKLKYELETMEMDGQIVAVPVGDGAKNFHGMITMNKTAEEMISFIKKYDNPDDAFEEFTKKHPDENKEIMAKDFCAILNELSSKGLLLS